MAPPVTPSKPNPKDGVGQVIDRLNLRWKLELSKTDLVSPRSKTPGQAEQPSQECVRRIRFLFYKNPTKLDSAIGSYEDWAKTSASDWRWKARQERGTLPSRPQDESRLLRNSLLEKIDLTESKKEDLVVHLLKVLSDECWLLQNESPKTSFNGRSSFDEGSSRTSRNSPSKENKPIPEIQGAQKASMLDTFQRTRSLDTDSKGSVDSGVKSKETGGSKRKSTDTEVFFSAPNSPRFSEKSSFGESVFDDFHFDFESLNLNTISPLSRTYLHSRTIDVDTDHIEVQNSEPAPPKKKSKPPVSIRNYMNAPKDGSRRFEDAPAFVIPVTSPPPLPSKMPRKSSDNVVMSFTSDSTAEPSSIFTPKLMDEPSTQDTEVSIFNELFQSFNASEELPAIDNTKDKKGSGNVKDEGMQMVPPTVEQNENMVYRELLEDGPFTKPANDLSTPLPLRCHYEVSRIANAWQVPVANLGKDLNTENYPAFWKSMKDQMGGRILPNKSQLKAWDAAIDSFNVRDPGYSVQFSGNLSWRETGRGVFQLRLNPLRIDKSCRLYRKFGSHRFLSILIPAIGQQDLPKRLCRDVSARQGISDWLSTAEHRLLGRYWRAFFVEPEKSAKVTAGITFRYKVHLFAVRGGGLQDISIAEMINWHIPLLDNSQWPQCKIFQRFTLGLSKTTPATILRPSEFIHLPDVKPVMNDGCARMSRSLAWDVAKKIGLNNVPSVFQARVAGAKGIWMVVSDEELEGSATSDRGFYIEVTDSQLKIKPHPLKMLSADIDDEKLTFEVVRSSIPLKPAHINTQLISILQDRGVDLKRLERLQQLDLEEIYEPLVASNSDRLTCRHWVQTHCPSGEQRSGSQCNLEIRMEGALPASHAEIVALLLESGFEPNECPFLVDKVKSILTAHFNRHLDKMRIKIPLSTYAYCIADPYGCLAPDEVHLGFSNNWVDETENLFADNVLHGMDVLVARLPAHLPSDIQRRKAVWKEQLRHFKDVIVFPTTGDRPLADLLSGGDYDGDHPWICWDPVIVSSFQNVMPDPPEEWEHFGIEKNIVPMVHAEEEIDGFLSRCFDFNLNPTFLESVSSEHERVRYHEKAGVSHVGAKELAVLAGLLVDAPKQGYYFSEQAWHKVRSKISPRARLGPAYKGGEGASVTPQASSYLDYLRFWVAIPLKDKLLGDFQKQWVGREVSATKDPDLSRVWGHWVKQAELERSQGHPELHQILGQLRKDVTKAHENFLRRMPKVEEDSSFAENMKALHNDFQGIEPANVEHDLVRRIDRETREQLSPSLSIWQWLRALCAHELRHKGKFSWWAAGNILCSIKAHYRRDSFEHVRVITEDLYVAMKTDSKAVMRIQGKDPEDEWDQDNEIDDVMMGLLESGQWD